MTDTKTKETEAAEQKAKDDQKAKDAKAVDPTAPVRVIVEGTPVIETGEEQVEAQAADDPENSSDPMVRAAAAGIGLIDILGVEPRYIGVSPAREGPDAVGPDGRPIGKFTIRPLGDIPFSPSLEVKDPASGTFYFPPDGCTSWEGCNLDGSYLIPEALDPEAPIDGRSKKKAAGAGGDSPLSETDVSGTGKAPSAAGQKDATDKAASEVNKDLKK